MQLPKRDVRIIFASAFLMLLLSLMDAGALALLSYSLEQSATSKLLDQAPEFLIVVALFILKSLIAALVTYKSMRHFEKIELSIGDKSLENLKSAPWSEVKNLTQVDYLNNLDKHPFAVANSLLFTGTLFIAEFLTATAIAVVILQEHLISSLTGLLFFSIVLILQNRVLGTRSQKIGEKLHQKTNESEERILEIHKLAKLLKVNDEPGLFDSLRISRRGMVRMRVSAWFLNAAPRYYMEAVLILGVIVVAASAYITEGSNSVFPAISLFAAAGYRLLPTINRMQGCVLTATTALPYINLRPFSFIPAAPVDSEPEPSSGDTFIEFQDVSFSFSSDSKQALSDISLQLKRGVIYALVGSSGSGKTTLAEMSLGLLKPSTGRILMRRNIRRSYVPQDTELISGSLEHNITFLGRTDAAALREALSNSELEDLTLKFKDGEVASKVSGGQKQRIGLARALYKKADFMVLDEATSALDNSTESLIIQNLSKLRTPSSTTLVIAHRLSTIRNADQIILLENGTITSMGSWNELMSTSDLFRKFVALGDLGNE